ncbi:hypothetical protein ABOM_003008 [Aspergillus bombycis]|uniref:Fungal-specific transcription factor domain-containing protein n=1 Tax=Aspergillus bombycis TaxID=109264 RepID=A0A1F8AAN9_9EURO|nr:hypothetical protein ABOM_003008 [Aspergillus bombycis]OGM48772.1 hypothetical protein ABOM_003008 [Aspergillus bombycis]
MAQNTGDPHSVTLEHKPKAVGAHFTVREKQLSSPSEVLALADPHLDISNVAARGCLIADVGPAVGRMGAISALAAASTATERNPGIRYRFADDVGTHRRNRRREPPSSRHARESLNSAALRYPAPHQSPGLDEHLDNAFVVPRSRTNHHMAPQGALLQTHDSNGIDAFHIDAQLCMMWRRCVSHTIKSITPDTLDTTERYLFHSFSERIAPMLVLVDDDSNSWRRVVLPVAHFDDLVKSALLSAAAFCNSTPLSEQTTSPEMAYQRVIRGLQQRQNLAAEDLMGKQCIILTLLVLLANVIVNGSPDFRTIFDLLRSSLKAVRDDLNFFRGEIGLFISTQLPKFRGYAAPFLSLDEGVATLCRTIVGGPPSINAWHEFTVCRDMHPDLNAAMSVVYELNRKACDIYLARAQAGSTAPAFTDMVEDFKNTLDSFPPNTPGEHTLVWPCFLVALESSTTAHRVFFIDTLLRHQRIRGFANLDRAIEYVKRVWASQSDVNWVQHLTKLSAFVV